MSAIPGELYPRLHAALLSCAEFESDARLRAIFADARLNAWQNALPEASRRDARVQAVMDALWTRANPEGERALVLLLRVLSELTPEGDAHRGELAALADELTLDLSAPVPPPLPANRAPANPFAPLAGRITDAAGVFGRERETRHALEFVQAGSSVALIGEAAVGKSSLLTRLLAELPAQLGATWEAAYLDLQPLADESDFFAALCDALGVTACRGYALSRALQGRRIVLAIDEVEKMTWDGFSRSLQAELRGLANDAGAPLKLLLAARQPLDALFPDTPGHTSPLCNLFMHVDVAAWDADTARAYLDARLGPTGAAFTDAECWRLIVETGGHPQQLTREAYQLFAQKILDF